MTERAAEIVFAASVGTRSGGLVEVAVTDKGLVYYTCREGEEGRVRTEEIRKTRRDVDLFLGAVDDIGVAQWQRRYGDASLPESWHVVLEVGGRLLSWCGSGEYPPCWDELCRVVEDLTGKPLR
jgi:hypothetical protein